MQDKLTFSLLQNAIDSLERSVDLLAWQEEPNEAKRMKQAILSVAHGVELLLKERLRQVHPALVWENVDRYPSLSARTVTVDAALGRLTSIGGLAFADEDMQLVKSLRDKRNAIEHFAWSSSREEANAVVGAALGFASFFSKHHLGYDFLGRYTKDDDTFHMLVARSSEFRKSYEARHRSEPWQAKQAQCDFCRALSIDLETGHCALCGHYQARSIRGMGGEGEFDDDIPF